MYLQPFKLKANSDKDIHIVVPQNAIVLIVSLGRNIKIGPLISKNKDSDLKI